MVRRGIKSDEDGQTVRNKLKDLEKQQGRGNPAGSSTMPLLNRCCCFSLITGAVLIGIYATVTTPPMYY